jgi:hypothetical protein
MAAAWPLVRARLAAALPAVVGAGVTVYDGPKVTNDSPTAYLTIAHQPSVDEDSAGSYDQDRVTNSGYVATESGTVLMELGALTGDPALPDAFGTADAIHAWVQADQTLGVLTPGSTATLAVEVLQAQNTAGAVQRLLLTLTYTTRLEA